MKHLIGISLLLSSSAFAFTQSDVVNGAYDSQPPVQRSYGDSKALPQQISDERVRTASQPTAEVRGINVTTAELRKWGTQFDNIIVINKAADVEQLAVYRFGKLVKTAGISSGTERWRCEPQKDQYGQPTGYRYPIWTGTPTGYYVPTRLAIDYHSEEFDDATMRHAVFFNGGIATHRAGEEMNLVGKSRASHGCVRLHDRDAADIFKWVLLSGGPEDPETNPHLQGECPGESKLQGQELRQCVEAARRRTIGPWRDSQGVEHEGFLEEVRGMLAEGKTETGYDGESLPYSTTPNVPDLNPDGTPKIDKKTGQPVMKHFRTLYIVECLDPKKHPNPDCSLKTRPPKPVCNFDQFGNPINIQPDANDQNDPRYNPQTFQNNSIQHFFQGLFGDGKRSSGWGRQPPPSGGGGQPPPGYPAYPR